MRKAVFDTLYSIVAYGAFTDLLLEEHKITKAEAEMIKKDIEKMTDDLLKARAATEEKHKSKMISEE